MTEPELKSFIAEIEEELNHGNSACKVAELLAKALPILRAALPKEDTQFKELLPIALGAYHQRFPHSPRVKAITSARYGAFKRRCEEDKERQNGPWWQNFFAYAARSEFLSGTRANERGWRPDFDFFLQPKSFVRVLEGYYHTEQKSTSLNDYLLMIQSEQSRKK